MTDTSEALTFRSATEADIPFLLELRVQIQILPEKQGRGFGSRILEKLLADAVRAKVAVSLSVLKANPARRLYERLGFRIVGVNGQAYDMEFAARS